MSTPDFFRSRLDQRIDLRHALAVLSTRLPWAAIEAAVAPKLAHQSKPAKRVIGDDLAGAFEGEFGGGVSPAGRPRLPIRYPLYWPGSLPRPVKGPTPVHQDLRCRGSPYRKAKTRA